MLNFNGVFEYHRNFTVQRANIRLAHLKFKGLSANTPHTLAPQCHSGGFAKEMRFYMLHVHVACLEIKSELTDSVLEVFLIMFCPVHYTVVLKHAFNCSTHVRTCSYHHNSIIFSGMFWVLQI